MTEEHQSAIDLVLVVGGDWHDNDYARLELLQLFAEDQRIRTRVFEDYDSAVGALETSTILVSYTCNVRSKRDTESALRRFVETGGRWFALHSTNGLIDIVKTEDGKRIDAPNVNPDKMEVLGSRFIAHPAIEPYEVKVAEPDHPLVEGIEPFVAEDELYLMEESDDIHVLLYTEYGGSAGNFAKNEWEFGRHSVMYLRKLGKGEVLYFTLGHARRHYDMRPMVDYYPKVDPGSWDLPVFHTLLERGLKWAKGELV